MSNSSKRVVVYGKVIDDKVEGVYVEGVYFGGVAETDEQEEKIKRSCANNIRGGYAVPRTFPIQHRNSLPNIFKDAKAQFDKIEREMVENETILEANAERSKKKR